ncbi:MAG: DUF898 domain-containing protein [Gammaproteobacteria bacterium]|nr:DUF898 domain-containing protein [Gammaproteobacteria bacterium]
MNDPTEPSVETGAMPVATEHRDVSLTPAYFQFAGSGAEYFRIWAVNLLLTILTLGIYSPWAKVRRLRYIYGNTQLQQGSFDYHAKPLAILIGRAVAVVFLLGYLVAQATAPMLAPLLGAVLALAVPWLIVRSRMFNMRYTSYRNIRLGFKPAYGESYKVIFLYGFLTVVTLGLAAPYAHYMRSQFIVNNTRYGNLPLSMGEAAGAFFFAYFLTFVAAAVIVGPMLTFFAGIFGPAEPGAETTQPAALMIVLPVIAGLAFYNVVGKFLSGAALRATVRASRVESAQDGRTYRMGNDWSLNTLLFIYVTNFIAMVCSLGLLVPWAQMRETRYLMNNMWIELPDDLDDVVARQAEDVSAFGDEIGQMFDVDLGL